MSRQDIHSPERWAEILKAQADLTKSYRHRLYQKVDIAQRELILDVGCGTGVITADIASLTEAHVIGIDIDDLKLQYAKPLVSDHISIMRADVLHLPFTDETFDLVVFNIVLTHIGPQQEAVCEMVRVTQKGGIVLAALEPDYAGTIEYPVSKVSPVFSQAFTEAGVEMQTGRKLRYLFRKAGLEVEIGLYGEYLDFVNEDPTNQAERFLEEFERTRELLAKRGWTEGEIEDYKKEELELIRNNLTFSFIPCFHAIGRK